MRESFLRKMLGVLSTLVFSFYPSMKKTHFSLYKHTIPYSCLNGSLAKATHDNVYSSVHMYFTPEGKENKTNKEIK